MVGWIRCPPDDCHTFRPVYMSAIVNSVFPDVARTSAEMGGIAR
jgi:hypothetical protein